LFICFDFGTLIFQNAGYSWNIFEGGKTHFIYLYSKDTFSLFLIPISQPKFHYNIDFKRFFSRYLLVVYYCMCTCKPLATFGLTFCKWRCFLLFKWLNYSFNPLTFTKLQFWPLRKKNYKTAP